MKKILIIAVIIFMIPTIVLAAQIDLSVDNTSLSIDETTRINVSVNGSVDGGQIGIVGLENFDIVGQQSSQSLQMINGKTTQIQKKEIIVKPKQSGSFDITALARDNGKEISSKSITINVQKSLIDVTKDKLLQNDQQQAMMQGDESNNADNKDVINTQKSSGNFDEDLLKKSQIDQKSSSEDDASATTENEDNQALQVKQLENFPKVEHISPFNTMFWIEFVGIILGLTLIVAGLYWIIKKVK